MNTNIKMDMQSLKLVNGGLELTSKDGDTIFIEGDNDWCELIHQFKKPYFNNYKNMIDKVRYLKPKAVYVGRLEYENIKIGSGFSSKKVWRMILGVPLFIVDKDSYFDMSFENTDNNQTLEDLF